MELNQYQGMALETTIYPEKYKVLYPALGLAGEAGEVADKVKKVIRDAEGELDEDRKLAIAQEIGDVLWYCAVLGYELETIAQMKSRKERGVLGGSGDNR